MNGQRNNIEASFVNSCEIHLRSWLLLSLYPIFTQVLIIFFHCPIDLLIKFKYISDLTLLVRQWKTQDLTGCFWLCSHQFRISFKSLNFHSLTFVASLHMSQTRAGPALLGTITEKASTGLCGPLPYSFPSANEGKPPASSS